ncbi:MAG: exodeoxyribonuclease VII small subunit [Opitutaceae bacterium]|nr:exodeoxyribonuclease VII small subunit [Opitutaceae bacterium]
MPETADPTARKFETNFRNLEQLAADLEREAISIDELIPRAQAGAEAARNCLEVLNRSDEALVEIDRIYAKIVADNGKAEASSS